MTPLILLGDSIIDNGIYVPGSPDVFRQIQTAAPNLSVQMRAVDGSLCADVHDALNDAPIPEGAYVFMSVGGNDALDHIGLLMNPDEITFKQAMETLWRMREAFRAKYAALLNRMPQGRTLVATIYNPNFSTETPDLQQPAEAALSMFNDVIQQEVARHGLDLLDLRQFFTSPEDYANPIEPSAKGGEKIAARVADWVGSPRAQAIRP